VGRLLESQAIAQGGNPSASLDLAVTISWKPGCSTGVELIARVAQRAGHSLSGYRVAHERLELRQLHALGAIADVSGSVQRVVRPDRAELPRVAT
jgi:hypothetical protein